MPAGTQGDRKVTGAISEPSLHPAVGRLPRIGQQAEENVRELSRKKGPQRPRKQKPSPPRFIGKDEAGSSNLLSRCKRTA